MFKKVCFIIFLLISDNNVPKKIKNDYAKALVKLYPQLKQKGLRRSYVIA